MGSSMCIEDRHKCISDRKLFGGKSKQLLKDPDTNLNKMFIASTIMTKKQNISQKIKKYKRKIRILEKQLEN